MVARYITAITVVVLALLSSSVHSEIASFDDPDCIKDSSLPADEEDNYVDCNTPESLAENKTRCCTIEGSKGCCTNETNGDKMIIIGSTIATVTVCVMSACFIVFWCNPDTIPCLKRCPCKCCKRGSDEFTETVVMTEDIKRVGQANQSYMRDNDEYAPPERYDMPEELKADVQDEWWGSAGTTNF